MTNDPAIIRRLELSNAVVSRENERLRRLCSQQQTAIEDLNDMADAVERLRDIARVIGCDHVDGPDGRLALVRCVDASFADLEAEKRRIVGGLHVLVVDIMRDISIESERARLTPWRPTSRILWLLQEFKSRIEAILQSKVG